MAPSRRSTLSLSLLALCLILTACDSPDDTQGPGEGEVVESETIALDGVLLMNSTNTIYLVDPNTGEVSARAWSTISRGDHTGGIGGMRSVASPCGRYVAYFLPDRDGIALMEFGWEGSSPTLTEVRRWELDTGGQALKIAFNANGDRVYTTRHWIDVHSDRLVECTTGDLVPLTDPYQYLCGRNDNGELYLDMERQHLPRGGAGQRPSLDTQWLGPQLHQPSQTEIGYLGIPGQNTGGDYSWPTVRGTGDLGSSQGYTFAGALPDNRNFLVVGGWQGLSRFSAPAGFVSVCDSSTSTYVPEPPYPHGTFEEAHLNLDLGLHPERALTAVSNTLQTFVEPFLDDYERVDWNALGVLPGPTADQDRFVYHVTTYMHPTSLDGVNCQQPVGESWLVDIHTDGSLWTRQLPEGLSSFNDQPELLRYGTDDWALYDGRVTVGRRGDDLFIWNGTGEWTGQGTLSLDRRLYTQVSQDGRQICLTRARQNEPMRCVPHPSQGQIEGIVGQGQHPDFPAAPPIIAQTSTESMYIGGELTLTGSSFGTSGTLFVGADAVPPGDILEWSNHTIRLAITAATPAQGPLTVETAAGRSQQDLVFWFTRTALTRTAFIDRNDDDLTFAQGLNLLDLGDVAISQASGLQPLHLDPESPTDQGLYRFFMGAPTFDSDPIELTVNATEGPYLTRYYLQPLPGLADPTVDQPLSRRQSPHPSDFQAFGPYLLERKGAEILRLLGASPDQSLPLDQAADSEAFQFERIADLPDHIYQVGAQTYVKIGGFSVNTYRRLLDVQDGELLFDDAFQVQAHFRLSYFAKSQDLVLLSGATPTADDGAMQLSFDGGQTFDDLVTSDDLGLSAQALQDPIGFQWFGQPAFLLFSEANPTSIHVIDHQGTFFASEVTSGPMPKQFSYVVGPYVYGFTRQPGQDPELVVVDGSQPNLTVEPIDLSSEKGAASIVSHHFDYHRQSLDFLLSNNQVLRVDLTDKAQTRQLLSLSADILPNVPLTLRAATQLPDNRWLLAADQDGPFLPKHLYLLSP